MIIETSIKIQKSARYFSIGEFTPKVKKAWFVLHGYGQLAQDFLKEFESISSEETIIIAPEALSKFYFRGLSGNIGASWMTKEDRENEIDDYVGFLNYVYNTVLTKVNNENLEIIILGFSQGCHTAVRWLEKSELAVSKLVLCSGSFPEDINFYNNLEYWKSLNIHSMVGSSDRLVDHKKLSDQIRRLNSIDIEVDQYKFEGGHKLEPKLLQNI